MNSSEPDPSPNDSAPQSEPERLDRLEGWLRRLRWAALLGALILVGVLGYRATLRENAAARGDTRFYQRGAQRFWAGEPLYYFEGPAGQAPAARPATAYTYLPPFAAALGWARGIPYPALRGLWLLASVLALALALRVTWRLLRRGTPEEPARPALWLVLVALLLGRFVVNDLAHGQVNAFLALLLAWGLHEVYVSERPLRGGVWIGLALVIKPTSWLLLPWLAVDRRWRALGAACGAGAAALLAAWLCYPGDYLAQLREWFELMPRFAAAESARPYNASLASSLQRLLAGSLPQDAVVSERLLFVCDLRWAQPLARGLASALVLVGLAGAFWQRRRDQLTSLRAAASVLALSALLSPITWKAHFVVLLAPVALLASDLAEGAASPRRWGLALVTAALFLLPSRGLGALGSGLEAWGGLSLGLILVFLLCLAPGRGELLRNRPE